MTEMMTIGVIGGGFGKRVLMPVCLKHPQLSVKWIATKQHLSAGVPLGVKATLRWEDIAEDPEVHAVVIATPHDLHARQVNALLTAGKHILCEKPLALSAEEAFALAKRCEQARLVGMMDYSFRFIPQRSLFQSLIVNGLVGHLELLRLTFFRDDFERWPSQWYYDRRRGGGALITTGSHLIDSIHWLTQSDVRWVNAIISMKDDTDVGFSVMMETESGCICVVDVSHRIPGSGKHTIEAYGESGSLFLTADGQVIKVRGGGVQAFTPAEQHRFGFGERLWDGDPRLQPTACVVDLFIQGILKPSITVPMNFWTATKNQVVIDAIWTSHLKKGRVTVTKLNH